MTEKELHRILHAVENQARQLQPSSYLEAVYLSREEFRNLKIECILDGQPSAISWPDADLADVHWRNRLLPIITVPSNRPPMEVTVRIPIRRKP